MNSQQNDFLRRVLIVAGVAILGFVVMALVWQTAHALLIVFAGVLLAVFLHALSDLARKLLPLSSGWALVLVCALLVAVIALGGWLLAERISNQLGQLRQTLPTSIQQLEQRIRQSGIGQSLWEQTQDGGLIPEELNLWSRAPRILSSALGVITGLIVILFVGVYLAAEPETYRRGIIKLVPPGKRERAGRALDELGHMLRWWIIGQAVSMSCVTALVTLGLWLLNVPLALTLGLIAGLLEFIPRFGPILGAVPAILISLAQAPSQTPYVILLYVGIQLVEGYMILPLIQRSAVALPPALTITTLFLMGVLFGFVGLLLAVPLTVVVVSLVRQLYVEDHLEDQREVETGQRDLGGLDVRRERFA
jgi:predicted PurR-regulated permease PerM